MIATRRRDEELEDEEERIPLTAPQVQPHHDSDLFFGLSFPPVPTAPVRIKESASSERAPPLYDQLFPISANLSNVTTDLQGSTSSYEQQLQYEAELGHLLTDSPELYNLPSAAPPPPPTATAVQQQLPKTPSSTASHTSTAATTSPSEIELQPTNKASLSKLYTSLDTEHIERNSRELYPSLPQILTSTRSVSSSGIRRETIPMTAVSSTAQHPLAQPTSVSSPYISTNATTGRGIVNSSYVPIPAQRTSEASTYTTNEDLISDLIAQNTQLNQEVHTLRSMLEGVTQQQQQQQQYGVVVSNPMQSALPQQQHGRVLSFQERQQLQPPQVGHAIHSPATGALASERASQMTSQGQVGLKYICCGGCQQWISAPKEANFVACPTCQAVNNCAAAQMRINNAEAAAQHRRDQMTPWYMRCLDGIL